MVFWGLNKLIQQGQLKALSGKLETMNDVEDLDGKMLFIIFLCLAYVVFFSKICVKAGTILCASLENLY